MGNNESQIKNTMRNMNTNIKSKQACQSEACAIQTCLADNDYDSNKCKNIIQNFHKCCAKYPHSKICPTNSKDKILKK